MAAAMPNPPEGIEIWGINRSYLRQKNLTRIYALDVTKNDQFYKEVAELDIPLITRQEVPHVPKSRAWPREERKKQMEGFEWYTCTLAYMISDAIAEGYQCIILHRLQAFTISPEYFEQIPCLNFWLGYAFRAGISILKSEDSNLLEPYPWQPRMYGYQRAKWQETINQTMAQTIRACLSFPVEIYEPEPSWEKKEEEAAA